MGEPTELPDGRDTCFACAGRRRYCQAVERTGVLAGLVAIVLALSSCAGGLGIGADTLAPEDLTAAADRTAQKRSAQMSFAIRFEGLP